MKTRREELEELIAGAQSELKALDDCEFKFREQIYILDNVGNIDRREWYDSKLYFDCLARGRISKNRKTLEDKDRREIIETQLLKYEVKGGGYCLVRDGFNNIGFVNDYNKKYGQIEMSEESAEDCLDDMNRDDLIWYLTRGFKK